MDERSGGRPLRCLGRRAIALPHRRTSPVGHPTPTDLAVSGALSKFCRTVKRIAPSWPRGSLAVVAPPGTDGGTMQLIIALISASHSSITDGATRRFGIDARRVAA